MWQQLAGELDWPMGSGKTSEVNFQLNDDWWEVSLLKLWSVLVCLGCYSENHKLVTYKHQKFTSYSSGGWQVQDQGFGRFDVWWGPTSWFPDTCLLLGSVPGRRSKGISFIRTLIPPPEASLVGSGKESTCQILEPAGDAGLIPGSGRSPGEGTGNPVQYSCLGNPMDREPGGLQSMWSQESWTQLSN